MDKHPDLPADLVANLRLEVGRLRARESRRVFDLSVSVGSPAHERAAVVVRAQDLPAVDAALRTDIVAALVDQTDPSGGCAWVTRPGVPEPHDHDLAWLAASEVAFGVHGRELRHFFAVTRSGWLDVRTGDRRTWRRLRL